MKKKPGTSILERTQITEENTALHRVAKIKQGSRDYANAVMRTIAIGKNHKTLKINYRYAV